MSWSEHLPLPQQAKNHLCLRIGLLDALVSLMERKDLGGDNDRDRFESTVRKALDLKGFDVTKKFTSEYDPKREEYIFKQTL